MAQLLAILFAGLGTVHGLGSYATIQKHHHPKAPSLARCTLRQMDKADTSLSVAAVDGHLDGVRPAIKAMGGAVEVASVEGGTIVLRYKVSDQALHCGSISRAYWPLANAVGAPLLCLGCMSLPGGLPPLPCLRVPSRSGASPACEGSHGGREGPLPRGRRGPHRAAGISSWAGAAAAAPLRAAAAPGASHCGHATAGGRDWVAVTFGQKHAELVLVAAHLTCKVGIVGPSLQKLTLCVAF